MPPACVDIDKVPENLTSGDESTASGDLSESAPGSESQSTHYGNLDSVNAITNLGRLPSLGSAPHAAGQCRPCCFYTKGQCMYGQDCAYCHLEHAAEKKRSKAKGGDPAEKTDMEKKKQNLQAAQELGKHDEIQESLEVKGTALKSAGTALHPNNCTECQFFFFSQSGCNKGVDCQFCHDFHPRTKQKKNRRLHRRLIEVGVLEAPELVNKDQGRSPTMGFDKGSQRQEIHNKPQRTAKPATVQEHMPLSPSYFPLKSQDSFPQYVPVPKDPYAGTYAATEGPQGLWWLKSTSPSPTSACMYPPGFTQTSPLPVHVNLGSHKIDHAPQVNWGDDFHLRFEELLEVELKTVLDKEREYLNAQNGCQVWSPPGLSIG